MTEMDHGMCVREWPQGLRLCVCEGHDGLMSMGVWCVYDQDDGTWIRGMARFMFRKDREMARCTCGTSELKALDC